MEFMIFFHFVIKMKTLKEIGSAVTYFCLCMNEPAESIIDMATKSNIKTGNKTQYDLCLELALLAEKQLFNTQGISMNDTTINMPNVNKRLDFTGEDDDDQHVMHNRRRSSAHDRSQSNIMPSPVNASTINSFTQTDSGFMSGTNDDIIIDTEGKRTFSTQTEGSYMDVDLSSSSTTRDRRRIVNTPEQLRQSDLFNNRSPRLPLHDFGTGSGRPSYTSTPSYVDNGFNQTMQNRRVRFS